MQNVFTTLIKIVDGGCRESQKFKASWSTAEWTKC